MTTRTKVFGIGLMKTGTTTLGSCFQSMGYRHFSYFPKLIRQNHKGEFDATWDVVDRFESFEDHPWPSHYQEIERRYPDAKFVLTVRKDSETWYGSLTNHARRMGPTAERRLIFGYGWPLNRRDEHISFYEEHNQAVIDYFEDRPEKLLVVCWEDGSTWQDVAEFLGTTVETPAKVERLNSSDSQSVSPQFWFRNTVKYLMIGRLGFDPFRNRGFEQGVAHHMGEESTEDQDVR